MGHRAAAVKAEPPPDIHSVWDSDEEQLRLAEVLDTAYTRTLNAVHQVIAEAYPEVENFRLEDSAVRRLLLESASRVVRIDETTRQAIASTLAEGASRGLSAWEIANGTPDFPGIEGLFTQTWRGRALMVARTELQHAQNRASIDRYLATGLVDRVEIIDGDDDEPCKSRNGTVVPIEQAPSLAHPNCTLVLVPVLRAGIV